jgi:hypothetical protein
MLNVHPYFEIVTQLRVRVVKVVLVRMVWIVVPTVDMVLMMKPNMVMHRMPAPVVVVDLMSLVMMKKIINE